MNSEKASSAFLISVVREICRLGVLISEISKIDFSLDGYFALSGVLRRSGFLVVREDFLGFSCIFTDEISFEFQINGMYFTHDFLHLMYGGMLE